MTTTTATLRFPPPADCEAFALPYLTNASPLLSSQTTCQPLHLTCLRQTARRGGVPVRLSHQLGLETHWQLPLTPLICSSLVCSGRAHTLARSGSLLPAAPKLRVPGVGRAADLQRRGFLENVLPSFNKLPLSISLQNNATNTRGVQMAASPGLSHSPTRPNALGTY